MENINLYKGDCLDVMDRLIEQGIKVNAIITDPPYGTTACAWDIVIPFDKLWEQCNRLLKDNGSIVFTASQPFTSILLTSNLKWFSHEWIWEKEAGSNFLLANKQPMKIHESILVFNRPINEVKNDFSKYSDIRDYFQEERKKTKLSYKEINEKCFGSASNGGGMASNILTSYKKGWSFPSKEKYEALQKIGICERPYDDLKREYLKAFEIERTYNPIKTNGKPYVIKQGGVSDVYGNKENNITTENNGDRFPTSILKFKRDKEKLHSTQKPVSLMEYLIKTYTNENETVLDFTMGSGTTGVACVNTNRKFIGIELDDNYFEIAKNRIEKSLLEKESKLF